MRGTTVLAFAAGVLCGAVAARMTAPSPPVREREAPPWLPVAMSPATPSQARKRIEEILSESTGPDPWEELAAARKEARSNLLKGTLLLEVGGRTPAEILKPWKDIEPERGTVRFSSDPERMAMNPWMTLSTILPEEFEEALARALDNSLRWVEPLHLAPEEARAIRDYTERAYRLMVEVQQRQAALRRMLADTGRCTPEERKALEEKYRGIGGLDERIYDLSFQPAFKVPLLFPPAGGK